MYAKGANNIKTSLEERFGARESKSIINEETFFNTYFASGFNKISYKVESFADFQTVFHLFAIQHSFQISFQ